MVVDGSSWGDVVVINVDFQIERGGTSRVDGSLVSRLPLLYLWVLGHGYTKRTRKLRLHGCKCGYKS